MSTEADGADSVNRITGNFHGIANQLFIIMGDSLLRADEVRDGVPADAIKVEGIVRTYAFHRERLLAHKDEVRAICNEMADSFQLHPRGGGGASFLSLCMNRHGALWGQHIDCENLVVLAIGCGMGGYCLPRAMWAELPGGVPYVWFRTGVDKSSGL